MDENFELAKDIYNALTVAKPTGDQVKINARFLALICQHLIETGAVSRSDIDTMIAEAQR